jgi:sulfate transport system permease protein
MAALTLRAADIGADRLWATIASDRALAAYALSFGASLAAGVINAVFGFVVAWTLTRYRFPGRRLLDAVVDLPFALPTAVSGIALAAVFSVNGWLGRSLVPLGVDIAFTRAGVVLALVLVSLPFVVRTLQPAIEQLDAEAEAAAATLGASRFYIFRRVVFPALLPALLTGFALAFARALGEYGSVIFIAGNRPMQTEIAPLLIVIRLEEYDYAGATAIGLVMLVLSFVMLLAINALQLWTRRRLGGERST